MENAIGTNNVPTYLLFVSPRDFRKNTEKQIIDSGFFNSSENLSIDTFYPKKLNTKF